MKIDRRSFFKVATGVIATTFIPGTLIAKIPIRKENLATRKFEWVADSDWGIISYVATFDDSNNLIQINPVDYAQTVNKGDSVTLNINIEGERARVCYIGLFNDLKEEVSGEGYSRIKTWILKLVKG